MERRVRRLKSGVDPSMPPELSQDPLTFVIKSRSGPKRVDAYLTSRFTDYSRSVIQKVIDAGAVKVNGIAVRASQKIREGDEVTIWLPELADPGVVAEDIPLEVLYEDAHLTVIHKPPGMVTHPGKGHWRGTLVNALQFRFDSLSTVGGLERPGIVHRLDRDTSGLLIVARDDLTHQALGALFETRQIHKEYLALVSGIPERDRDIVEKPIGPHPTHREKMAIRIPADGGKTAKTYYEVIERFQHHAFVRCLPETGRTHQIRVHLTHAGLPILADKLYSGRDHVTLGQIIGKPAHGVVLGPDGEPIDNPDDLILLNRQALHAYGLRFTHPITEEPMKLVAPLPPDMSAVLEALRKYRPMTTADRKPIPPHAPVR